MSTPRSFVRCLLIAVAAPASSASITAQAIPPRDSAIAFVDVTVVPMDRDRLVEHQTVLIRGAVIDAVGPATSVKTPATATRIDGRGKLDRKSTRLNSSHLG